MKVILKPGQYVVAVSGGVDSMVLLDVLARLPHLKLIVAHFEHGIRQESDKDCERVEQAAARYGLPFVSARGHLGPQASEAAARAARYEFLRRVKHETKSQAIITAHHQDDMVETAILNMLRGTGRKGLSSLQSTSEVIRPLLQVRKQELYDYAAAHPEIHWVTEATNYNDNYLRNYLRHHVIPKLGEAGRGQLLARIQTAVQANPRIDEYLRHELQTHSNHNALQRPWFMMLPYEVSCEIMAAWLRTYDVRDFDRKTIARLTVLSKVALPGKRVDIDAGLWLEVGKTTLIITSRNISKKQSKRV